MSGSRGVPYPAALTLGRPPQDTAAPSDYQCVRQHDAANDGGWQEVDEELLVQGTHGHDIRAEGVAGRKPGFEKISAVGIFPRPAPDEGDKADLARYSCSSTA